MVRLVLPVLTLLLVGPFARSQDDDRDRIVKTDGRELRGRVLDPFATDELTLLQGGKRVRVPRADVATLDTVADRMRRFAERRVRMQDNLKAQEYLIDEAVQLQLPGLARLQAMWVAQHDPDNQKAHEFLGHPRGAKGWLWLHEGKKLTRDQLEASLLKQPMRLRGERFTLQFDAGFATNLAALFDLELLGITWLDRFGAELQLHEVLTPIDIQAHRNADTFPKWGFRPLPYFVPNPHGDIGHTFYAGPSPKRPERLFFVGTEALLYHTLIGDVDPRDNRDRVCAWLEIGFGMLMQHTMDGPPGFAAPGPLRAQDLQALQALGRGYRLTHLLHLPMYSAYYLADDTDTAINWAASTMFVAWLLQPDNQPPTRAPFLRFVRASLGDRKGDSSSAFDKIMGRRIEAFDEPWREWLAKTAGY